MKWFIAGALVAIVLGAANGGMVVANAAAFVHDAAPYVAQITEAGAGAAQQLRAWGNATPTPTPTPMGVPAVQDVAGTVPPQIVADGRLSDGVVTVTVPTVYTLGIMTGANLGTAFYVSPSLVLTAQHVTLGAEQQDVFAASRTWEHVYAENPAIDVTAMQPVTLNTSPPTPLVLPAVYHPLADRVPALGESVTILCRYSRDIPVSPATAIVMSGVQSGLEELPDGTVRPVPVYFAHDVSGDVHNGCSGAPVVDGSGQTVGIFVARWAPTATDSIIDTPDIIAWLATLGVTP